MTSPKSLLLALAAAAFAPLIEGGTTHTPVLVLKILVITLLCAQMAGWRGGGALYLIRSPLDAAAAAIAAAAVFSAVIAPYKFMALTWVQLVVFYILFYYLARNALRRAGGARVAVPAVLAMGALQTFICLYQWSQGAVRVNGTFFNPNMAAGYIAATLLLALSLMITGNRYRKGPAVYMLGVYTAAGLAAMLVSGSRGAALSLVAGVFVVVWFRSRAFAVVCALLLAAAVVILPNPIRERALSGEPFAYSRAGIWKATARMAIDHPQGVGLGNYKYIYDRYAFPVEAAVVKYGKKAATAHNELLHFTAETGIPGLAAILFGLFALASALLSSARRPVDEDSLPVAVWAIGGLAAFTAHSLVDSNFHEPGLVFLFILMVCMGLEAGSGHGAKVLELRAREGSGKRPVVLGAVLSLLLLVWAVKPELARWYHDEATERMKDKEPAAAAALASRAVSIEPSDASGHEGLASAMFALYAGSGDEARFSACLEELEQAEGLNPNNSKYPDLMAYVKQTAAARVKDPSARRRLIESAFSDLERAVEASPFSAELMYKKAMLALKLGDTAGAEDALRHIVDIEPNFLRARLTLAEIYRDTGRKKLSLDECYSIIKAHETLSGMPLDTFEEGFVSVDMAAVRALVSGLEA